MQSLYTIGLYIYFSLFRLVALFHPKAAEWWALRRDWSAPLDQLPAGKKTIWIHVASAGEFEQAVPLIHRIRESGLPLQLVVSAFSVSGLRDCQNSGLADVCFAFPPDLPENVKIIIQKIQPAATVFIRNEIWLNTLKQLKDQLFPAILINAEREDRKGIYGRYLNTCYPLFSEVIYTDKTGSTKTERVLEVAAATYKDPCLEAFSRDSFVLILGSCYDREVQLLARAYPALSSRYPNLKLVFCPHEWDVPTPDRYQRLFGEPIARYSAGTTDARLLFIDRMGILKYIYRYADAAFVGGGYGMGVHNVSEAAVYGIPVVIGPNHQRFPEVGALIRQGQVLVIETPEALVDILEQLLNDPQRQVKKETRKLDFANAGQASGHIWKTIRSYLNR